MVSNILVFSLVFITSLMHGMMPSSSLSQQAFKAMEQGDDALVVDLLDRSTQHPIQDGIGRTLLYFAAQTGNIVMINVLLDGGYDVNARDVNNDTALHAAAQEGHLEAAKALILCGADAIEDCEGVLPIHCAANSGNTDLIELCLNHGMSVNSADDFGGTPLHYAAHNGHVKAVIFLLAHGAYINVLTSCNGGNCEPGSPLHVAVYNHRAAVMQVLLDAGASVNLKNGNNETALDFAITNRDQWVVEMLLGYGAEVPAHKHACSVIKKAKSNRLKLLHAKNFKEAAQVLAGGAYPLLASDMLVDEGRKELFRAIDTDDVPVVSQFLKDGFTLNTCDKEKNMLLHRAIAARSLNTVKLLMALGAHKYLDTPNIHGVTPMHLLSKYGYLHILVPICYSSGKTVQALARKQVSKRKHEH